MHDPRPSRQLPLHLPGRKHDVRARLAVEAEGAVPLLVELDEGQGGRDLPRHDEPGGVDPQAAEGVPEEPPEAVLPHLADESGPAAEAGDRREHVRGRAARIARKERRPPVAHARRGKIDQQFADRDYVIHIHAPLRFFHRGTAAQILSLQSYRHYSISAAGRGDFPARFFQFTRPCG